MKVTGNKKQRFLDFWGEKNEANSRIRPYLMKEFPIKETPGRDQETHWVGETLLRAKDPLDSKSLLQNTREERPVHRENLRDLIWVTLVHSAKY